MQLSHGVSSPAERLPVYTLQREWRGASYWCSGRRLTRGNCAALRFVGGVNLALRVRVLPFALRCFFPVVTVIYRKRPLGASQSRGSFGNQVLLPLAGSRVE